MNPATDPERAGDAQRSEAHEKPSGLLALLLDHHAAIDASCLEMMGSAFVDDPPVLARRWAAFEHGLLEHMAAEEQLLLPSYQVGDPEQAQELRADHLRLRESLERIALDVELHEIRIERLKDLVGLLRAHAHLEETTLYPWIQRHLPAVLRKQLFARIGKLLRGRHSSTREHAL